MIHIGIGLGIPYSSASAAALATPVISGFAYPANVLTSTVAGQWFVNGQAVIGETGNTYTVRLTDIGALIQCANSNVLTCWHPNQIAAVARFRAAIFRANTLSGISPNVQANDGSAIRRVVGLISGDFADQATAANQPIYRLTGQAGNPSWEFDGVDDNLALDSLDVFQNRANGYLFVGARSTNPTGGSTFHIATGFERGGSIGVARLAIATKGTGGNFEIGSARTDGGANSLVNAGIRNSNYNVHTAEALWASNVLNYRINGSQVGTGNTGGAGNTSNTPSFMASIGSSGGSFNPFPGHITCVICANPATPMSATDRSRIERFIGLMGGLNIPLV